MLKTEGLKKLKPLLMQKQRVSALGYSEPSLREDDAEARTEKRHMQRRPGQDWALTLRKIKPTF